MLCLLVSLPGGFEIKMAGEDVLEDVVELRQNDGKGFHPFKVGGVVAAGDDIAFGIAGPMGIGDRGGEGFLFQGGFLPRSSTVRLQIRMISDVSRF